MPSSQFFKQGFSDMMKEAGVLPFEDLGLSATLFGINTDKRNYELDEKLDQIIKRLSPDEPEDNESKVRISGLDQDAKSLINKKKKLLAEVIAELKASGKLQ